MARRDTRELILQTSLALFNELGEPNTSTNHIADETGISPGNLYYHFRSKQGIVVELFSRFSARLDPLIAIPLFATFRAEDLWFQLHLSFELKGQYRFLFRDPVDITTAIPGLRRAFLALYRRERASVAALISSLQQSGSMHIDGLEKEVLLNNLMLAMMYWIPFAEMFGESGLQDGDVQIRAIASALQMIIPYMSEDSAAELTNLAIFYLSRKG